MIFNDKNIKISNPLKQAYLNNFKQSVPTSKKTSFLHYKEKMFNAVSEDNDCLL